jgi:Zn-dependent oligopeptidase
MQYADNRRLRATMYRAFATRATISAEFRLAAPVAFHG